ncbi:MAG: hypothetical protein SCK29_10835 [Bacillota bacterium]|nr:hypothetical protein [Bacillota bacterium]MDW7684598.1 hypothetical protein [Bacillota bacterium]
MNRDSFTQEEQNLIRQLGVAGLPDDIVDVICKDNIPVDERTKRSIQVKTLRRIHGRTEKRPLWLQVAAAAFLAMILVSAVVGPNRILAGINGLVRFVPGFGLEETEQIMLALAEPVKVVHGENEFEINGLLVNDEYTIAHIRANGPSPDSTLFTGTDKQGEALPYLEGEDGARYPLLSSSISYGGTAHASLVFGAIPSEYRNINIALPDASEESGVWHLGLQLTPADELTAAEDLKIASHKQGITVTAFHSLRDNQSVMTLLIQSPREYSLVREVGNTFFPQNEGREPFLQDDRGTEYTLLRKGSTTGYLSDAPYELRFDPADPSAGTFYLSIPEIRFHEYIDDVKVTLPVPDAGKTEHNQQLQLGRFSVTFTGLERVTPIRLRMYVDPGPDDGEILEMIGLNMSHSIKVNEETGRMEYIETEVEPDQNKLTFTVGNLQYAVKGPWEFEIPLN